MKCDIPICTRDALAWCCVDGMPCRLCDRHMHGATRGGCWVEVDWHAPLDGPAPRFEGRPCSSEPVHTVEVMPPDPKPRREREKCPDPELASPARAEGICRNRWCTWGRGGVPRPATKRGLCDVCYGRARDRGVLSVLALPLDRPIGRPLRILTVNPSTPPHLCRVTTCPGKGTARAKYRGICSLCIALAKERGVWEDIALPLSPRRSPTPELRPDADAHPELCRNVHCSKPPARGFRGLCSACRQTAANRGVVDALSLPRRSPGPPKGQSIPRPILESA